MKIGFGCGNSDPGTNLDTAVEAERLGFDMVSCADSQNLWPEMTVTLTAAAMKTRRVMLGPMVSNPLTRHPAVTAAACSTLQVLSGGRFFYGVGSGDSALTNIGERPVKLEALAEYIRAVKTLCGGGEAEYRGRRLKLQWGGAPVPVWMAAEGPRSIALAGGIADGVIFANGISEDVVTDNIRRMRAGAAAAGRNPDQLRTTVIARAYFAASEQQAWKELGWTLAAAANHSFKFTLENKFVPPHLTEPVRGLMREYRSDVHSNPKATHNAELVTKYGLQEFLGRRFVMAGGAREIAARIRELGRWGVHNLVLVNLSKGDLSSIRRIGEEVLPLIRGD